MSGKRARVATVATAGVLTLAAAISSAVLIPSGAAAGSAGTADAHLMVASQQQAARAAHRQAAQGMSALDSFRMARAAAEQRVHKHEAAVARAAAARAAAAKETAARAAARQASTAPAQAPATPPSPAVSQQPAPAPTGSPQQIAEGMLAKYGWSSSQFSCLQPLWERESGWNPYAQNPGSGAYGIPQALPGSQMASAGADWQTNPATQIRWGLSYIQGRYGSPCAAWAHEQADGWY